MEFMSQKGIYDPSQQKVNIQIIGAGSTGSFLALTLAKMGIEDITVFDFDKIEDKNIPNQFYRIEDVGKYKVDALKEIIKDFTGNEINISKDKIEEETELQFNLNTIVILCVDNMRSRNHIYKQLKNSPIRLIDTRFGSEGYSIHNVNLDNEEEKTFYEHSLDSEIMDTPCGQKGVIYTILSLASEVSNIIKKVDCGEKNISLLKREMKTYRFISREEK